MSIKPAYFGLIALLGVGACQPAVSVTSGDAGSAAETPTDQGSTDTTTETPGGSSSAPPAVKGLAALATPTRTKVWKWSCTKSCTYRFAVDPNPTWEPTGEFGTIDTATADGAAGDGTYYVHVQAKDAQDRLSEVVSVPAALDNSAPNVVAVAYHGVRTIEVTFSEAMGLSARTASNYTLSGSGRGSLAANPSLVTKVSGTVYRLTWTAGKMLNGGDLTVTVGGAKDLAGNAVGAANAATHASGAAATAPAVTIERADSQDATTSSWPLLYDVMFSEAIDASTFATTDFVFTGGTLTPSAMTLSNSGDNQHFTLVVTPGPGTGTYAPALDAGAVSDSAGNASVASTSVDATISFADPSATLQFAQVASVLDEGNDAHTQSIDLVLSTAKPYDVTVNVSKLQAISGGRTSAIMTTDFDLADSTPITIFAGQTTATLSYTWQGNTSPDTSGTTKAVELQIASVSPSGSASISGTGVRRWHRRIIRDDDGGFDPVTSISTGNLFSCAIRQSGALMCNGRNSGTGSYAGQVGDASTTDRTGWVAVDSATTYAKVVTSLQGNHACAITTASKIKCWGLNTSGQLGNNSTTASSSPVAVDASTDYIDIAVGSNFSCGVTSAYKLKCWGASASIGNGYGSNQLVPVAVDASTDFAKVAASPNYVYALVRTSGVLKGWSTSSPTIGVLDTGTTYKKISTGAHTASLCGITSADTLRCRSPSFTDLDSSVAYASVSAGLNHFCAITTAGAMKCWGTNSNKQLGDGTTTTRSTPVGIDAGTNYTAVAAGYNFTCGLSDGIIKCWGANGATTYGYGLGARVSPTTSSGIGTSLGLPEPIR